MLAHPGYLVIFVLVIILLSLAMDLYFEPKTSFGLKKKLIS